MGYGVLAALLTGLDLWIKQRIEREKPEDFPKPMRGTGGKILLYRNHNAGFPFGFLEKWKWLVMGVPLVILSALTAAFCVLLAKPGQRVKKLGFALVIGGGLSNLYDRLVRGYVVDYFSFQAGILKKVVFNLGDLFVFLGSAIVAILDSKSDLPEKSS